MAALTLQQMRVLVAVLEHRSFTRGAQAVFMTQSAASQHIRSLEQALGIALVARTGGAVLPTRAGEGLLRYAREMLRTATEAEAFVASLRAGRAGRLALGAAGSALYVLPPLLAAFRAAYPDVDVALEVMARAQLYDAIAGGVLDAGLVAEPVGDTRLDALALCTDRVVCVASPSSPALVPAAVAPLPIARLASQPIIGPAQPSSAWERAERRAREAGLELRPVLRLDGADAIKRAVEAGLGIAFLSAWVVEREIALGTLREITLEGPPLTRQFTLLRHGSRAADALLGEFLAFAPERLRSRTPALVTPLDDLPQRPPDVPVALLPVRAAVA